MTEIEKTLITSFIGAVIGGGIPLLVKTILEDKSHKSRGYHEKRVPLINELFLLLRTVANQVQRLHTVYINRQNASFNQFELLLSEAQAYYNKNLLYFDNDSRKLIDEFFTSCYQLRDYHIAYSFGYLLKDKNGDQAMDKKESELILQNHINSLEIRISPLLDKLEKKFSDQIK